MKHDHKTGRLTRAERLIILLRRERVKFRVIADVLQELNMRTGWNKQWSVGRCRRIYYWICPKKEQYRKKNPKPVDNPCSVPGCNKPKGEGRRFLCEKHFAEGSDRYIIINF